jgi:hypothetical protein
MMPTVRALPLFPVLLGCPGPSASDSSPAPAPTWTVLAEDLPAAILSITQDAEGSHWFAGADPGDGGLLLRLDPGGWSRVPGISAGDLWWVHAAGEIVRAVGAGGRVVTLDAAGGVSEEVIDPGLTFYGAWFSSPEDGWIVGGNPDEPADAAALFRRVDDAWERVSLPAAAAAAPALFKVDATSPAAAWAVGAGGVAIRWDGSTWSEVPTGTTQALVTVHGDYAVGGAGNAVALTWDGARWIDESPRYVLQLSGVHDGAGGALAVGAGGSAYRRGGDGWEAHPNEAGTHEDLHAAWVDDDGSEWAVGGHISSTPLVRGVILRSGPGTVPTLEAL